MRVTWPDCTTSLEATLGEAVVCPACFSRFEATEAQPLARRFDVHLSDGTVMPRQSLHALREAVYVGKISISARVRGGEGELVPIYSYPTFARIYALLGIEVPTGTVTRRIAGWDGQRPQAQNSRTTLAKPQVTPQAAGSAPRWPLVALLVVVLAGSVWMAVG